MAAESRSEAAADWGVVLSVKDDEFHVELVGAMITDTTWSCYLEGLVEYAAPEE